MYNIFVEFFATFLFLLAQNWHKNHLTLYGDNIKAKR